jgi:hypothetical protein
LAVCRPGKAVTSRREVVSLMIREKTWTVDVFLSETENHRRVR